MTNSRGGARSNTPGHDERRNTSVSANIASALAAGAIRSTQALGLRGGATLVKLLAATKLGRGSVARVTLPSGRRIAFPAVDPYWAPYLWGRRTYEPDVEQIFRRLGRVTGKLLVDGGANIGYWTVQMSTPQFGFDHFIAVEANAALVPLLEENVSLNGIDCKVVHAALADKAGETVYLGGTQNHAVAAVGATGTAVTTTTLDVLVSPELAADRMVIVKLDIEGSEIAAIEGARQLSTRAVFLVEDWPRSGFLNCAYLLAKGYCVIGVPVEGSGRQLDTLEQLHAFNSATTGSYGPSNLVVCRPRQRAKILDLLA